MICSVLRCERPARSRGWCNPHYQAAVKWGDPLGRGPTRAERIWVRIARQPSGCWHWTGAMHSGGRTGYGWTGSALAHRAVYELLVEPIPEGLTIDHLCRVPLCVNPSHLEPVTMAENIRRAESPSMVTNRSGVCGRGHSMEGPNVYVVPRTGARRCLACVALRRSAA